MEIKMYNFPTLENDGITAIEKEYCRLLNLKRQDVKLDEEVQDWMDSANSILMEAR